MNRIRGGATALVGALLLVSGMAYAQEITGRVTGRVSDKDTGAPLGGVTVIVQGPQGEDATLTDDRGDYLFSTLTVGTYAIRFYVANTSTQVEQAGVIVSADKTVRVNAKISAGAAQAAAQQTYVITGRAPSIDVGSARIGTQFDEKYTLNLPLNRTYGDVIARAPGAFVDASGNVSIAGATGLENIYLVNGLNVTGVEYGNLEAGTPTVGGGTNLPIEFLTQVDVNAGGYQAEFGGAMGGVINSVLKSGSNEFHGSVFSYWSPYWLSTDPTAITTAGRSLGYVRKPDFDTSIGGEVGGPLIKDKLFFWFGFAPRFQNTHVFRQTYVLEHDDVNGGPRLDPNGIPIATENTAWRARIPESRKTYYFGASVDFIPTPDHKLTLGIIGSPNFNNQMRSFNGIEFISHPSWAREQLTKNNTDITAHWTSHLLNNKWQIDALAGMHSEYYYNRSPWDSLNYTKNQLEYWGANLRDLEGAPGCASRANPDGSAFEPCPVDNYHTGGFGYVRNYTAYRWMGELKSTHRVEALGRHEIKYGYSLQLATLDQDRFYSGEPGNRALVQLYPQFGGFNTGTLFTLPPNQFPSSFGPLTPEAQMAGLAPFSNLLHPGLGYQDNLKANVKSLSNSFFVQDSYSPDKLRNLTLNLGARLELQKLYDYQGSAFLNARNLGPRIGAVYDPFNDGRSKVSVSYGRYFEAIPLSLAARYFGGEGLLFRQSVPLGSCTNPDPYGWQTSNSEWRNCNLPPANATDPNVTPDLAGGYFLANNGRNYPVQSHLSGQYHNEVVATLEREVIEDTTVRLDYIHRWLGTIIEDGTADPSTTFVLANPGHVPGEAIKDAQNELNSLNTNAMAARDAAASDPTNTTLAAAAQVANAEAANANAKLVNLKTLAVAPKPTRTYDALTVSVNHRFSKNWLARASYTYSRLVGNYEGLYQTQQNYFAPNGNNAYDTPDLYHNQYGALPNDRPHLAHVDGFYTHKIGKGQILGGLSFSARSGMPRNYISALLDAQNLIMLLPRGEGGRTPTVTEVSARLSYRHELSPKVNLEAFIDFFNILNQQAAILVDDVYTFNQAAPIINGSTADLKYAKNVAGAPVDKNPNYGRPLLYQQPFNARMGMKLTF